MKSKTLSAYIGIFFYAAFVGFSFLFVKNSAGIASPLQTMTFRFAKKALSMQSTQDTV